MKDENPGIEHPPAPEPPPPPRRRRWKKILLVLGGLFVALILAVLLLGPSVAASVAKSKVESILGEKLSSSVTVGTLSLGWSGHVDLDNFRIAPRGFASPLLDVKEVNVDVSVASAIGGKYIAKVEVVAPKIVIEKDASGRFNYDFPKPREEPKEKPKEESGKEAKADARPHVQAELKVRDGEVVLRDRGRETVFKNVTLEAKVDTLEKPVEYSISLENPTHGKLSVKGSFDIDRKSGPVLLVLERLSLKNLAAAAGAYGGVRDLDGTAEGTFEYQLAGLPGFSGKGRVEVKDLAVAMRGQTMRLDRLSLAHEGALDGKGNGRQKLALSSGKALDAVLTADVTDALGVPGAKVEFQADSDLGELGRALQGLVEFKPGLRLEGQAALGGLVETKGSAFAKFDVNAAANDVELVDKAAGKRQELEKAATLALKGSWDGTRSAVDVETVKVASSCFALDGGGRISLAGKAVQDSSFTLKADLAGVGAKLPLFMADPPGLAGSATANGKVAGDRYEVDAAVKGLKVVMKQAAKETVAGPIDATIAQKGLFENRPGGKLRIEESRIESSAVTLTAAGEVRKVMEEAREGDLKVDLAVRPAELSKWMPDLGMGGPEIRVAAAATLRPKLLAAAGKTQVDGLTMAGKDALGAAVTRTAKTGPLEFSVEMKDKDILAKLRTALFEWVDKGYAAKGGLDAEVSYNGEKGTSGTTKVANLEIVDDRKNVVKDPAVTVVHDVGMSPGAYEIRKAEVTSTFIRGGLAGRVKNLGKEPEFAGVRGSFKYIPDRLGAVLAPWMPGKLEGAEEKTLEIRLDGKAKAADVLSILRAGEGSMDVDLAKYTHTGVSVSGKTRLDLKDGQARSATPLQVNKGRTEMGMALDFREKEKSPRSTLDFKAREVDANADMGPLLEKIHPIFFTNRVGATVDGKVDSDFRLAWEGPVDPAEKDWIAAASRNLRGTGAFSGRNLAIVGSPAVEKLMEALGEGNRLEGELTATDIRIGGGRCAYDNMTLRMKRYELRFSGWVGFDRKMKLMVEMPMTEHVIKKYPNLQKYIGKTFFVPLEGTVDSPRLDFDGAIAELLKRAMEGVIQDKAKDLLDDLLKRKKKDK